MKVLIIGGGPSYEKWWNTLAVPDFFTQFDQIITIHDHRNLPTEIKHHVFSVDSNEFEQNWVAKGNHMVQPVQYFQDSSYTGNEYEQTVWQHENVTSVPVIPGVNLFSGLAALSWALQSGYNEVYTLGFDYDDDYLRVPFSDVRSIVVMLYQLFRFSLHVVGDCHTNWQSVVNELSEAQRKIMVINVDAYSSSRAVDDYNGEDENSNDMTTENEEEETEETFKRSKRVATTKETEILDRLKMVKTVRSNKIPAIQYILKYSFCLDWKSYTQHIWPRTIRRSPALPNGLQSMDEAGYLQNVVARFMHGDLTDILHEYFDKPEEFRPASVVIIFNPLVVTPQIVRYYCNLYDNQSHAVAVVDKDEMIAVLHPSVFSTLLVGLPLAALWSGEVPNVIKIKTPNMLTIAYK